MTLDIESLKFIYFDNNLLLVKPTTTVDKTFEKK